ncbi:hypothetical protein YC2023_009079 [Brassica napus]
MVIVGEMRLIVGAIGNRQTSSLLVVSKCCSGSSFSLLMSRVPMVRVDLADFTSYGGGFSGRLPFRFFFHEWVWSGSFRLS